MQAHLLAKSSARSPARAGLARWVSATAAPNSQSRRDKFGTVERRPAGSPPIRSISATGPKMSASDAIAAWRWSSREEVNKVLGIS